MSYEQIIDEILDPKFSYRGIEWQSSRDLSLKLGKGVGYVHDWLYKGKTYEQIIYQVLDKQYKNITWYSDSDLSIQLGKSPPYVKRHLIKGETYAQIIDYILAKQDNKTA